MNNPTISIIVPVYGVEAYISQSMYSVCQQTYKDFEVILVDDSSKDKSIEIACEILKNAGIMYSVVVQVNQGQGVARMNGVHHAHGKWISFLDPDDTISPDFLDALMNACIEQKTAIAYCDYKSIFSLMERLNFSDNIGETECIMRRNILSDFLTRKRPIALPTMLINKEFIINNNLCINTECRFSEDVVFIWQLLLAADKICHISSQKYNYLQHGNSTMTASSTDKILTGYVSICNMAKLLEKSYPNDFDILQYIVPRWTLGAMRTAAKMLLYTEFMNSIQQLDYKINMKKLKKFPEIRAKILALLAYQFPHLYYKLIRAIK